jgi:hypothetical protein
MKKRSKFSLSHYVLKTCKMGYVLPVGLVEVLPGDSFRHATSVFMRLAPMLAPVMHPVTVRIHHWFIPTRLLWDDFEDFITGGPTNTDVSEFPTITAPSGGFAVGSLADQYAEARSGRNPHEHDAATSGECPACRSPWGAPA